MGIKLDAWRILSEPKKLSSVTKSSCDLCLRCTARCQHSCGWLNLFPAPFPEYLYFPVNSMPLHYKPNKMPQWCNWLIPGAFTTNQIKNDGWYSLLTRPGQVLVTSQLLGIIFKFSNYLGKKQYDGNPICYTPLPWVKVLSQTVVKPSYSFALLTLKLLVWVAQIEQTSQMLKWTDSPPDQMEMLPVLLHSYK